MNVFRRKEAHNVRGQANDLSNQRPHPRHISNEDEQKFRHKKGSAKCHVEHHGKHYANHPSKLSIPDLADKPSYLMTFTKGLPHNFDTGLVQNPDHVQYLIRGIDSGDFRDFRDTPLGSLENTSNAYSCKAPAWKSSKAQTKGKNGGPVDVRAWESQSAGLSYDMEGPDAQAVTMPPAPKLGSPELTAEMAEIYAQALLRDKPFNTMSAGVDQDANAVHADGSALPHVQDVINCLNDFEWFDEDHVIKKLTPAEEARRRCGKITAANAFRGITRGDDIGPYLSQFLLIGNEDLVKSDPDQKPKDGLIQYGAITTSQKVRVAALQDDHMTTWDEWYDVQNGADLRKLENYDNPPQEKYRFMYTPRDLATYVHYDALYEAYLNACLILIGKGIPFDPGIPFQEADNRDHQQGFAHFGGPHILSLVTEVATRALKAVRFQKYNVHRRCRPEVVAARLTKHKTLADISPELSEMKNVMAKGTNDLLVRINKHNNDINGVGGNGNYLLPMAFCEGSPMHPSYGAGHATVAGACVTILKAFFDHKHPFKPNGENADKAYVSVDNGERLQEIPVLDKNGNPAHLTVEGELNKLASNISIGRDWAGVHYFSDYYESILMGEQIALGILEEQKLTYTENFSMTVPLFDGTSYRI